MVAYTKPQQLQHLALMASIDCKNTFWKNKLRHIATLCDVLRPHGNQALLGRDRQCHLFRYAFAPSMYQKHQLKCFFIEVFHLPSFDNLMAFFYCSVEFWDAVDHWSLKETPCTPDVTMSDHRTITNGDHRSACVSVIGLLSFVSSTSQAKQTFQALYG